MLKEERYTTEHLKMCGCLITIETTVIRTPIPSLGGVDIEITPVPSIEYCLIHTLPACRPMINLKI